MATLRRMLPALLLAVPAWAGKALAQSNDPSFRLNNRSNQTINEVYVSSANDQAWGADRLGANVLPSGQSLTVQLPRGQCMNDVRVVFADGQAKEQRRIDTCQLTDLNVQ
jgi:hypothetical protein